MFNFVNDINLIVAQDTSDFTIWHFLIFGLPRPFQGGEYYGTIRFYEGFPETQPSLNICTPNGRVDLNTDLICMLFAPTGFCNFDRL